MDVNRRTVLKGGAGVGTAGFFGSEFLGGAAADISRSADWGEQDPPEAYDDYETHRVAQDGTGEFETIQAAVDSASARDLVLVEPGVYNEEVEINDTDRLTIRGTDREEVVLDGEFERYNGIVATTDGVVVENLTVRNYNGNGVYWLSTDVSSPVRGYRGSYITADHIGVYAIYARNAEQGRFEHCYASGCKDAGYYIGESQPARAVITDCIAEYNAMGYSGTNAGGDLVIKESTWRQNMCGIVPNTLDSQAGAPQGHIAGGIRVENNHIHDNNRLDVPAIANAYAVYGTGVAVAGGQQNDICENTIENQAKYGVVVFPMITDTSATALPMRLFRAYAPLLSDDHVYPPEDNAVMDNEISGSGRVDLALAAPADGNAFDGNDAGGTRPMFLEQRDGSFGDVMVFLQILRDFTQTEVGDYPSGTTEAQPDPDFEALRSEFDSYEMDDPEGTPPRTPVGPASYPEAEGGTDE
jgi:hypothetical protein